MGFINRKGHVVKGMKVHSWINNPNQAHKKCTKCGLICDIETIDGKSTSIYTTKDGQKSTKFIECI